MLGWWCTDFSRSWSARIAVPSLPGSPAHRPSPATAPHTPAHWAATASPAPPCSRLHAVGYGCIPAEILPAISASPPVVPETRVRGARLPDCGEIVLPSLAFAGVGSLKNADWYFASSARSTSLSTRKDVASSTTGFHDPPASPPASRPPGRSPLASLLPVPRLSPLTRSVPMRTGCNRPTRSTAPTP